MLVKKFEAPTLQEALKAIKKDLGPEAIILSTKNKKAGFGLMSRPSVEITAAVSERQFKSKREFESSVSKEAISGFYEAPAAKQADIVDRFSKSKSPKKPPAARTSKYIDIQDRTSSDEIAGLLVQGQGIELNYSEKDLYPRQFKRKPREESVSSYESLSDSIMIPQVSKRDEKVETEMNRLKKLVEELTMERSFIQDMKEFDRRGDIADQVNQALLLAGLSRSNIVKLFREASQELEGKLTSSEVVIETIAALMMEKVHTKAPSCLGSGSQRSKVTALVGAPGVGKTLQAAKLSLKLDKSPIIGIYPPVYAKEAASLETYCKILGVEFRVCKDIAEYRKALLDLKNENQIIVDTPGISPKDSYWLNEMEEILLCEGKTEVLVCLDATSRDEFNEQCLEHFSALSPAGIVMSKLDELSVYGGVYNISQKTEIPLMLFSIGNRVPDDLEIASPERVISLIVDLN